MGVFSNYYMYVVHQDENILHLRRDPTWKSLVLFLGELTFLLILIVSPSTVLWAITHFVSLQARKTHIINISSVSKC